MKLIASQSVRRPHSWRSVAGTLVLGLAVVGCARTNASQLTPREELVRMRIDDTNAHSGGSIDITYDETSDADGRITLSAAVELLRGSDVIKGLIARTRKLSEEPAIVEPDEGAPLMGLKVGGPYRFLLPDVPKGQYEVCTGYTRIQREHSERYRVCAPLTIT